ncbi:hypothetical protein JOF53_002655 [Crossiella equi]|uniref:Uncharacterized protein n=1 Tax=Crossiella equi TaxID=130796 RepID=A0ABS5AB18_9PSEU|nr:hypothetical protein [Crossiella equi]MBP2473783.1 hypothetical protein [Crossiella equi]
MTGERTGSAVGAAMARAAGEWAGRDRVEISYLMHQRANEFIEIMKGYHFDHARYTRAEAGRVRPLMIQFYSLMYKGDFLYEQAQREGRSTITDHSWKREMIELVRSHRAWDAGVARNIEELERYYILEGRVQLGEVELTEEVFREVNVIRSAVIDAMVRVLNNIKGVRNDEALYSLLVPFMLFLEVADDVRTYGPDVAEDSFNSLRLFVRMHGRDAARQKMREYLAGVVEEAVAALRDAPRAALLGIFDMLLLGDLPRGLARPVVRVLPRAVLVAVATAVTRLFLVVPEVPEPVAERVREPVGTART